MNPKVLIVLVVGIVALLLAGLGINLAGDPTGKISVPGAASHPFRVATDYPSLQTAVDSLGPGNGGTVYIPAGRYRLDQPSEHAPRIAMFQGEPP